MYSHLTRVNGKMGFGDTVERFARLQARRPGTFLLVAGIVTAISAVGLSRLRFDSSYEALLPRNAPQIANMNDVRARTGGTRQVVVAITGADAQAREKFARRLLPVIEKVEGVRFVDIEYPVDFFEKRGLFMLDTATLDDLVVAVKEAIDATKWFENPMNPHLDDEVELADVERLWKRVDDIGKKRTADLPLSGVLSSKDGRWTFMVVIPSIKFEDIARGKRFSQDIKGAVDSLDPGREGLEVRYAGNLELVLEQNIVVKEDLRLASIVAIVLGVLLVAAFTRRPAAPALVGVPLLAGVAWTFAIVGLAIGHVNIITGFLASVLIGLGIDFGIHLLVRYQQERDRFESTTEAMVSAVQATFRPALTSAATTAATFFSFVLAEFRGFSEFGLIASIGVVLTMLSSFLVLPPMMVILDRKRAGPSRRKTLVTRVSGRLPLPLCAAVVVLFSGVAIWGVVELGSLDFKNDLRKLRGDSPAYEFFDYVNRNMGAGFNPAVILVDGTTEAARVAKLAMNLKEQGTGSRIGKTLDVSDFLPGDVDEKMKRVRELADLVKDSRLDRARGERAEKLAQAREMVEVEPWTVDDLPETIRRRFVTLDGAQSIVYVWPTAPNYTADECIVWEEQLDRLASMARAEGIEIQMAEETLIVGWIHRLVEKEAPQLLAIAGLVTLLLLMLDLRKVRSSLLVASPLVMGMLVFVAAVHATGQHLNLFNIIVVPSIVGIGIDNSVHIYHRYRMGQDHDVLRAMTGTGVAALLASATTAIGFGSSLVAHHAGLRTMGTLAMTGVGTTFLSAVIFFPCLLVIVERLTSSLTRSRSRKRV